MSVPTGPVISGVNEVGMSSVTQDISVRVPAALRARLELYATEHRSSNSGSLLQQKTAFYWK